MAFQNHFVVFNGWKRIVKMMQQFFPFLIFLRPAKSHRVVFKGLPIDEQDVAVAFLQASLKLM